MARRFDTVGKLRAALFSRSGRISFVTASVVAGTALTIALSPWVRPEVHPTAIITPTELALSLIALWMFGALIWYRGRQAHDQVEAEIEIDNLAKRNDELRRKQEGRMQALRNLTRLIGLDTRISSVFDAISKICVNHFGADSASLMIYDEAEGTLTVKSSHGTTSAPNIVGMQRNIGDGIAGSVAKNQQSVILGASSDGDEPAGFSLKDPDIASSMVVPILVRGCLVGVVNITSRSNRNVFDHDDLCIAEIFAEIAGLCIRHHEQSEWLRQVLDQERSKKKLDRERPRATV